MNSSSTNTRPRAVLYCRVSTGRQAEEGTSLETQEADCRRKAAGCGAEVVGLHTDPDVSGELYLHRPGIQAALADIEQGRADMLIGYKVDRSGRNARVILEVGERIRRAGGALAFTDDGIIENTARGQAIFGFKAIVAQWEKDQIRGL